MGVGVGCTTIDDVDVNVHAMDMGVADLGDMNPTGEHEHAFVMRAAPGMTAAEAVEAIAEAAELRGITPTSVVLSHTQVSPSHLSSGGTPTSGGASPSLAQEGKENEGLAQEIMFPHSSYRSMTPQLNHSPSSASARAAARGAASGVAGVPDVDVAIAGVVGSRVSEEWGGWSPNCRSRLWSESIVNHDISYHILILAPALDSTRLDLAGPARVCRHIHMHSDGRHSRR